ncbi:hypothetical protein [Halorientalis marina]|jgi:hypothetical protein|uniref:hypothetical protein n=1 Tax=Halorientalis marina TaxID=2931976 RepID=UPI001FF666FE|nr:hypothetical protein [Halorientalis marina]
MEIRVDLDEELVDELDEEARLQGFDDRAAYLRWIVSHRPMSELATTQAPAVASRVSELEERVKLLERQLDLDEPVDPDADLGSGSSGGGSLGGGSASGGLGSESSAGGLDGSAESGGASLDDVDTSTESMDLAEPEDAGGDDDEMEAGDDDIAEAIGDVEIEDDEGEDGGDGVDGD